MKHSRLLLQEVVVDSKLAALSEPVLLAVVLVAKVVAVCNQSQQNKKQIRLEWKLTACGDEREVERVVGRAGAAVGAPVQSRRVLGVSARDEVGEGGAEKECIGNLSQALTRSN